VAGSTGEGVSLTARERRDLTKAFVQATAGRIPVIVQVGHNSSWESRELAAHAQEAGADAISSTSPSYFKPNTVQLLVAAMKELAEGAPALPFYYYHIPALTGVPMDMVHFLEAGAQQIPTLAGIKFSDLFVPDYQACLELDHRRFDILWGCDEMLLSALAVGAEGAVGSTFNVAAPLYLEIMERFRAGDIGGARERMFRSVQMVRLLNRYTKVTTGLKEVVMPLRGFDLGRSRLPVQSMSRDEAALLKRAWVEQGFEDLAPTPVVY
jgi:N-acetylneuraminate lyase